MLSAAPRARIAANAIHAMQILSAPSAPTAESLPGHKIYNLIERKTSKLKDRIYETNIICNYQQATLLKTKNLAAVQSFGVTKDRKMLHCTII
jgi:hypothetical protein